MFKRLILGDARAGRPTVGVRVIAAELFERFSFRADVLVILGIPFEISSGPCAVFPTCLIKHWDVGSDVAINEPS